jgi:SRSO17 transposase
MDPSHCDESCLQQYLNNGKVFSFLSNAQDRVENKDLNDQRLIYVTVFNLGTARDHSELKIALLIPHRVIGRYAYSTTNAVFAYMLAQNRSFDIKTFQIEDESPTSIARTLNEMKSEGYYFVIAPLTREGAGNLTALNADVNVYFPTVHQKDFPMAAETIYFGGIDYQAQLDAVLKEASSPLVIFYDQSPLGSELNSYTKEAFMAMDDNATEPSVLDNAYDQAPHKKVYSYAIERQTSNIEYYLKDNEKITEGSFVLNTPIVKSGMVMSQLTMYEANATNILSTQINYDPIIFSMTQYQDRKSMIIANSIGEHNNILVEANNLLSNDIVYDAINYATTVGVDLFYHIITNSNREYDLPLVDNQINYPITLVRPSVSRFLPYTSIHEPLIEAP